MKYRGSTSGAVMSERLVARSQIRKMDVGGLEPWVGVWDLRLRRISARRFLDGVDLLIAACVGGEVVDVDSDVEVILDVEGPARVV